MRLLGVLALAAPVALGILFLAEPRLAVGVDRRRSRRSVIAAVAAATDRRRPDRRRRRTCSSAVRFGRLVKAAERIAAGDYTVDRRRRAAAASTAAWRAPINGISTSLAETHDQATIDRLTGVANRQALLADAVRRGRARRRATSGRCRSPSSTSTTSRPSTTPTATRPATSSCAASPRRIAREPAGERPDRPVRRRGIHAHPDRDRRRGGRRPHREAAHSSSSGSASRSTATRTCRSRSRSGSPAGPARSCAMETLVRDADAAMYSAKSLGRNQTYIFAEPDDDARVPRAPISTAGRARAMEIGRQAREAATDRADLGHRPAPPLPRPAVGAHRRRSSSRWPGSSSCPRPRSTGSSSPPCSTTSARSPSRRRSSRSRPR